MLRRLLFMLCSWAALLAHAGSYATLSESARIALLTNSPGNLIYTQYGHTSIRVTDTVQNIDLVFNYGIFDFTKGNFAYRFAKGETDYQLGIYEASYMYSDAAINNITVTEQSLNLKPTERQRIFDALMVNYEPQNRVYRYNFWFDNCSTRPYHIIKNAIDGTIVFPDTTPAAPTFRSIINQATEKTPWNGFGINLALGKEIDRPLTFEESFFLPAHLMRCFAKASIERNDTLRVPLVQNESVIMEKEPIVDKEEFDRTSPQVICNILFLVVISFILIEQKKQKTYSAIDISIWIIYGLIGMVLWFLMLFSKHPATGFNASAALFHPFYLAFAIASLVPKWRKFKSSFYVLGIASIMLFFILKFAWVQEVPVPNYLLACILTVRCFSYFKFKRKKV